MYLRWMAENMWIFVPAQVFTRQWLESFKEFPPRGGTTLGIAAVVLTRSGGGRHGQRAARCLETRAGGKALKVHLGGYDMLDDFKNGGEGERGIMRIIR
jgi:hypothetical protein